MSAQPCLPQDIIEVNKNKEYTLISTDLLESVLTDQRLNAQTTQLWQLLFNYARYNPDFKIKISYAFLAKKLGKSSRTISRYIDSLTQSGYLIITHNFDKNGGQRPSTISVRVPKIAIDHAKTKKDRHTKNISTNNEILIKNEEIYSKGCLNELPTIVTEIQNSSDVLHGTIKNSQRPSENNEVISGIHVNSNIRFDPSQINNETSLEIASDKTDRGGHDNNVIQIENNKKEFNKNNNHIVSLCEESEKTKILEQEISELSQQLTEGNKLLLNIKSNVLLYDQIKRNSKIEATLHLAKIALERLQKKQIENTKQRQISSELTKNPKLIHEKIGARPVPPFTFKRLIKSLISYGYNGKTLNTLTNEIIYEARFGTLINCNKTNKPLSLDNAINIGLKLVREKRWSTPKGKGVLDFRF